MKKWKFILIGIVLFMLIVVNLVTFVPVTADNGLTGWKICLDPGHGGSDPGAVNEIFDLKESEINLDVSFGYAGCDC